MEKGKNRILMQVNTAKMHNGPKCFAVTNLLREDENVVLFTTNLYSSQFPKHELSSKSIKKQRGNLKGSFSTQQHPCGDLQGLTNPHILQQQHPLGALEPLCILVNHTPHHYTSMLPKATAALLTWHFQSTLFWEGRWRGKICIYSRFSPFDWVGMINT